MQITAAVARERLGAFSIEQVELTDPRADEVLVQDRRQRHVPDRPARARRLLRHAAVRRCSATKVRASWRRSAKGVTRLRPATTW